MKKKPAHENKEHLSSILDRYKDRFRPPQASVEKIVQAVIEEVSGFALQPTQIEYTPSTKTIYLKVPSVLKNELRAKQTVITTALQKQLPKEDVPQLYL